MARFQTESSRASGAWLVGGIIAILAAAAGLLAGARFDLLAQVNSLPRLPLDDSTLTTGGIILAVGVVVASLIGALLGGLAGDPRHHRRVDRAGAARRIHPLTKY